MKVFLSGADRTVLIQCRAESDDGEVIGDLSVTVAPGEDFMGHSYADLVALGEGEQTITEKETS